MASPQLENGFAMIASELVAAIFIADFPKYEKVVLADILLSLYGPQKLKAATIDHIRLAGMIGVDPRITRRAVAALIKRRVIKERANGTFTFVKDWESWTNPRDRDQADDPLCHLIGSGERRFIAYSTDRFSPPDESTDKRKRGTRQSPRSGCRGTIQSPNNPTRGTRWSPINSDASSAAPGDTKDLWISSSFDPAPPDPPLLSTEEREERPRDKTHTGSELVLPCPPAPTDAPACVSGSPDEVETLARGARTFIRKATVSGSYPEGNLDFADFAAQQCRSWFNQGYPVAIIKQFVRKAVEEGAIRSPTNWSNYVQASLNSYAQKQARLKAPLPTPPAPAPPSPADREAASRKFKEEIRELRARGGRPHAG